MKEDISQQEQTEEVQYQEEVKFGYGASAVFLIFIAFIIYITVIK